MSSVTHRSTRQKIDAVAIQALPWNAGLSAMSGTVDVVVGRAFAATPERVFDAFLDAGVARHFLFATTYGESIEAIVDPRVRGGYVFTERRAEMGDVRHTGEYLQIERPKRLVFTFAVPQFGAGFTVVTIEIEVSAVVKPPGVSRHP